MSDVPLPALELWDECGGPDVSEIATPGFEAKARQVIIDFYNAARAERDALFETQRKTLESQRDELMRKCAERDAEIERLRAALAAAQRLQAAYKVAADVG